MGEESSYLPSQRLCKSCYFLIAAGQQWKTCKISEAKDRGQMLASNITQAWERKSVSFFQAISKLQNHSLKHKFTSIIIQHKHHKVCCCAQARSMGGCMHTLGGAQSWTQKLFIQKNHSALLPNFVSLSRTSWVLVSLSTKWCFPYTLQFPKITGGRRKVSRLSKVAK